MQHPPEEPYRYANQPAGGNGMSFPPPLGGLLEDEDDLIVPALLIGELLKAPDKAAMASVPKVSSPMLRDVRAVLFDLLGHHF